MVLTEQQIVLVYKLPLCQNGGAMSIQSTSTAAKRSEPNNSRITVEVQGHEFRMTKKEARSLILSLSNRLRGAFAGGRPRDTTVPRCHCGLMTVHTAQMRYHHCGPETGGGKNGKGEKGKR
jgi:hypothetical protein